MDLKSIIETALNIPVLGLSDPVLSPCATWYQTFEEPELSGDGNATEESESYEINIWCDDRQEAIDYARVLKNALIGIERNTIPTMSFTFDNNGKLWRGSLNFKHVKEG